MSKQKEEKDDSLKENNPCWKGYEPIGMKKKNGKEVPNCVPKNNTPKSGTSEKKS
ncbi:hypothetical protein MKJ04_02865 [Pontibacter sp. E15-1]|uniref:hypothetical protein n=1 Tax=Pontibacter sp. E15-1 TaxID=2919918 RepID=UPI001F4FA331|nr:hypothetical protein [Pontibacter sp. E15-1]MCJ8163766.1 hypothetical protein [Pontibacter sp. E15-1]